MPISECEAIETEIPAVPRRRVARVLLADSDLASRLTLKSLMTAAGYAVECAASASEAIGRLDVNEYQLVLADLRTESEESGARLLAYARQKEYHPATALISSKLSEMKDGISDGHGSMDSLVRISDENVSYLLARVADLISQRAGRRIRKTLSRAS